MQEETVWTEQETQIPAQEATEKETQTTPGQTQPPQPEATPEQPETPAPEKGKAKHAQEAALRQKAEKLEQELNQTKDTLLRTAAEYENFRKRSAKERDAAFGSGLGFAVERLLPVLDTLELAAAAETADESYKKGVLMTLDKCREVFTKLEVTEIDALGKPFDPELHAAVMQQPAPEGTEPGTVLQVLQKGYQYQEKVLRHVTVIVAE